ncbi:hypothetical protein ACFLU6_05360 [Acidobacteriota bacterium]
MRYPRHILISLIVLLFSLNGFSEVSVIKGPDGTALHLLKITDPEQDLVWQAVTHGGKNASWLNPEGDEQGDLEPLIILTMLGGSAAPDEQGNSESPHSDSVRCSFHRGVSSPSSMTSYLGIPDGSDFEANIILDSSRKVASYLLPFDQDFRIIAVWPALEPVGYRLYWTMWNMEEDRWKPPSRVATFQPTGDELDPSAGIDGHGRLMLTWREGDRSPTFWRSVWTGSDWSTPVPLQLSGSTDGTSGNR